MNSEDKYALYICSIEVFSDVIQSKLIGRLDLQTTYEILNFEEVVILDKDTKKLRMPLELNQTFVSIAISSTRGYWAAKVEGTKLSNFPLPVLDTSKFKFNEMIIKAPTPQSRSHSS